jgi:hypothetical protein
MAPGGGEGILRGNPLVRREILRFGHEADFIAAPAAPKADLEQESVR